MYGKIVKLSRRGGYAIAILIKNEGNEAKPKTNSKESGFFKIIRQLKASGKLWLLIGAACIGIILIIVGGNTGRAESSQKNDAVLPDDKSKYDIINYSEMLEKKIRQLCESVNGVSNVSVAVTLNSGFEYVYAVNQKNSFDAGGNNTVTEYLIIKKGSEENVVYITGIAPQIKGVGIVCTNGSNENVKYEIINLVSAAFDVKKSKIYVSESKKSGKK